MVSSPERSTFNTPTLRIHISQNINQCMTRKETFSSYKTKREKMKEQIRKDLGKIQSKETISHCFLVSPSTF